VGVLAAVEVSTVGVATGDCVAVGDGVAAGVVYVAAVDARFDVSQTEVASTAGVSKSTVVNRVNDIRDWRKRRRFEGVNYNELKRLASENDVDVGMTPEREYLVDRLAGAGVEP